VSTDLGRNVFPLLTLYNNYCGTLNKLLLVKGRHLDQALSLSMQRTSVDSYS